jgi:hypothetical protein
VFLRKSSSTYPSPAQRLAGPLQKKKAIKRLARYAETSFASFCALGGALCHESQEDENGWDYHVELPDDEPAGPADTAPPEKHAYVQVKSTRNARPSSSVKLSNALKAARSRDPWFVVLMVDAAPRPKIYAIHIWAETMKNWLKAGRKASIERASLSKRRVTINFTEADLHSEDLIEWMQQTIAAAAPDYASAKKQIYETVGYEDGFGTGKLSFKADDAEQIFDELLGLGSGLPVSKFTFTQSRFGLFDKDPMVDVNAGTVQITPQPVGECELRIRGPKSNTPISIAGKVFGLGMPWIPIEQQRIRVSAPGFEIVLMNEGDSKFTASLHSDTRVPLDDVYNFATMITWLGQGSIDVQVWVQNKRVTGGTLEADGIHNGTDWPKVLEIVATLRGLQPRADASLVVSLADIRRSARDLYTMHQVTSPYEMTLEFKPFPDRPYDFEKMLYYATAEAGDLTAYALVEREVLRSAEAPEGRRKVEFGHPIIRESWLVANAGEELRSLRDRDFDHHLAQMENSAKVLEMRDIAVFLRAFPKAEAPEPPSQP